MNIKTFRIGGVHPEENKLTHDAVTQVAALPKQAMFPLGQHIGAPAKPVVQKGDKVKVGTMIAEAGGFVSAPIFSSVSGTVFKIDTAIDATGYRKPVIIINVEGDEWEDSIDRSDKFFLGFVIKIVSVIVKCVDITSQNCYRCAKLMRNIRNKICTKSFNAI